MPENMMSKRLFALAMPAVTLGLLSVGCNNTLETGYKPRALGDSATARRGYYAQPFTPEKKAAQYESEQEQDLRRPKPGF